MKQQNSNKLTAALASGLVLFLAVFALTIEARAAVFTVDSTTDAVDATPGDGSCATAGAECTLRAAIQEANALSGDDLIEIPAGTYTLTIAGTGENNCATGDLDITEEVTITGIGATATTIDANGIDGVIDIQTGVAWTIISDVMIVNGLVTDDGGGIRNKGDSLTLTNVT